ncbi:hypothetical protein [Nocardia bhagyanarayanae]|uniref:hypothetical protein n=1 Tax=Nocardia bhagyanarayanae TaxID=1215925 RepID=UPI001151CD29|nr:hypothetical protein [Nocardia bhagyanarayanae]
MMAHKPAQIMRHTAIVLAGAASLSLTFVAGTYIVNQMADTQSARAAQAAPPPAPNVAPFTPHPGPRTVETLLSGEAHALPPTYQASVYPAKAVVPQPVSTAIPEQTAGLGGRLGLGTAYVGAQVAPIRTGTVAFTVDTNAFSTLTGLVLSEPVRDHLGIDLDPSGITQIRTEIDTRSGEIAFVLSDANLGEHTIELQRHPAPADRTTTVNPDAPTGHDTLPAPPAVTV